jgi:hypothetical protein
MTVRTPVPPDPLEHGCATPGVFGQWLGALQVGIVDARQLADVSKHYARLEPHQIRTIDSWIAK